MLTPQEFRREITKANKVVITYIDGHKERYNKFYGRYEHVVEDENGFKVFVGREASIPPRILFQIIWTERQFITGCDIA